MDPRQGDMVLNRSLTRVRMTGGYTADINALTAYQFCAMLTARQADQESARDNAKSAVSRLSQLKMPMIVFHDIQSKLREFFSEYEKSS
jgi:hypothetical protein